MAKGHIFSKYAKLESAQKELRREVRKFNQRVERTIQSGELPKAAAPAPRSYETIMRYTVTEAGTAESRTEAIKEAIADLKKVQSKSALETVRTEAGAEVTKWGLQQYKKQAAKAKQQRAAAEKLYEDLKKSGAQIAGKSMLNLEHLKSKARFPIPEAEKIGLTSDFEKFAQRFERKFSANEWEVYRWKLSRDVDKHTYGKNRDKLRNWIAQLSPDDVRILYENKAKNSFIDMEFYYLSLLDVDQVVREAAQVLGRRVRWNGIKWVNARNGEDEDEGGEE